VDVERRQALPHFLVHRTDLEMAAAAVETGEGRPARVATNAPDLRAAPVPALNSNERAADNAKPRSARPRGACPLCSQA